MKIKLVSYSKPVIEDADNITDLVAYCARVSNPGNQSNKETSEKLIRYLINHQHWSPLEMVSMCLEIETIETRLEHLCYTKEQACQASEKIKKL